MKRGEDVGTVSDRTVEALRSIRLTLLLLFALAALSAAATIAGPRLEKTAPALRSAGRFLGLADPWHSPLFLLLVGLLAANVSLCSWHRYRLRVRNSAAGRGAIAALDVAVHFSLVVIVFGGIGKGLWGVVGTGYLFPGTPATTMYVEGTDSDLPLGFAVLLKEKREAFYPLRVKVGVRDAASGEKTALLEVVEGRSVALPGGGLSLSVREVRDDSAAAVLLIRTREGEASVTLPLVAGGDAVPAGAFLLTAVAWRRDVKDVRGRVEIIEGEQAVQEGWLEVNGALSHKGTTLFLTSWGADEFGNQFLGVQYRRDPAAPVFWGGAILFALALPPFVLLRRRRAPLGPRNAETLS